MIYKNEKVSFCVKENDTFSFYNDAQSTKRDLLVPLNLNVTHKLTSKETCPHFNAFKYESEGDKFMYQVKNIERIGKTN